MSNADKNESGKQGKKRTFAETAPVPEPEAACSGRPESAYHFTIGAPVQLPCKLASVELSFHIVPLTRSACARAEDVTAGAKAAAKKLRTAKASATREANAATLAQCSVGAAAAGSQRPLHVHSLAARSAPREPGRPPPRCPALRDHHCLLYPPAACSPLSPPAKTTLSAWWIWQCSARTWTPFPRS